MIKVIAEIGSNFFPNDRESCLSAIKSAEDCGADLVKVQLFDALNLSFRRGGSSKSVYLEQWSLMDDFCWLAQKVKQDCSVGLGASIFCGNSGRVFHEQVGYLSFVKIASQEFQWASLAQAVSLMACVRDITLMVSVPPDAPLIVGNYMAKNPIVWMLCQPEYPARKDSYGSFRINEMANRLPGLIGVSDHTVIGNDRSMASILLDDYKCRESVSYWERHFCYDKKLRGLSPDGGDWSSGPAEFKKLVEVLHGEK